MIELGVEEFQLVICAKSVDSAQTSGRRKNQMIKKVFAYFFLKKVGFSQKK